MTLECPYCGTIDLELVETNGAVYPEQLVERYECQDCHDKFTNVLNP